MRIYSTSTYPLRSSMPRCCGSRGVRAADQAPIGHRGYRDGLLDQAMEEQAPVPRGATVEAKGELVKVVGQVRSLGPALVGPEQPALQEGGHAVDAWQQGVGGLTAAADHVTLVEVAGGDDARSHGHGLLDEGQQALRRRVANRLQADAAKCGAANLDGDRDEHLLSNVASPAA